MSRKLTRKKVALMGPFPPPIGGVSVHIFRLRTLLESIGYDVVVVDDSSYIKENVINIRSLDFLSYFRVFSKADLVHIHSSVGLVRVFHLFFALVFRKRVFVTIHSWRKRRSLWVWLQEFFVGLISDGVVCVNKEIARAFRGKNTFEMPAFIPPDIESEPDLSSDILDIIHAWRDQGRRIISSNAFALERYNGHEIYGIDMLISLASFLVSEKEKNIGIIVLIGNVSEHDELFRKYADAIDSSGLSDYVLLIRNRTEPFCQLIKESDLTIRATNTDGDAISVRESLYFGVPVIASDAVPRPKGTILFPTRSQEALNYIVLESLENIQCDLIPDSSGDDEIQRFYSDLYEEAFSK